MPLRKFADHHDQMAVTAEAILDLANAGSPAEIALLQAKRIELSRLIADHCSLENDHLQKHQAQNDHPQKAALMRKFHGDLLAWRGALMECNANWPAKDIVENPAGFREVFGKLVKQLRERIQWEEREFYPAIFGTSQLR